MKITGIDGKEIEVTNLEEAISQAQGCVSRHEECKREVEAGATNVIYFKDAHKEWNHILTELKKLTP